MTKDIFRQYYEAKMEVQLAQDKVKLLSEAVAQELLNREGHRADLPEARITLRTDTVYEFSTAIAKQEDKIKKLQDSIKDKVKLQTELLKALKEEEISTGKAKIVSSSFTPVLIPVKEK